MRVCFIRLRGLIRSNPGVVFFSRKGKTAIVKSQKERAGEFLRSCFSEAEWGYLCGYSSFAAVICEVETLDEAELTIDLAVQLLQRSPTASNSPGATSRPFAVGHAQ